MSESKTEYDDQLREEDKSCNKCKEVKPLDSFNKRRASKDGLAYTCKVCSNAASTAWGKAYREAHPEKVRATQKAWVEANSDIYAAIAGKGCAIKRGGSASDIYDLELCIPFYAEARRLTRETGVQHHVDHKIPLSKGGLHCQNNLQVLTASENIAKGDSHE